MEIIGRLKVINPEQQVSATFVKRDFVITTDETYPQDILIELVQDKVDLIDPYKVGQLVKAHINLQGRCWTNPQGEDKYFNSIKCWRIEKQSESQEPQQSFEPSSSFFDEQEPRF